MRQFRQLLSAAGPSGERKRRERASKAEENCDCLQVHQLCKRVSAACLEEAANYVALQ
jgi:hypothetical protein